MYLASVGSSVASNILFSIFIAYSDQNLLHSLLISINLSSIIFSTVVLSIPVISVITAPQRLSIYHLSYFQQLFSLRISDCSFYIPNGFLICISHTLIHIFSFFVTFGFNHFGLSACCFFFVYRWWQLTSLSRCIGTCIYWYYWYTNYSPITDVKQYRAWTFLDGSPAKTSSLSGCNPYR